MYKPDIFGSWNRYNLDWLIQASRLIAAAIKRVIIGSGNGWSLFPARLLFEPIPACYQLDHKHKEHASAKFSLKMSFRPWMVYRMRRLFWTCNGPARGNVLTTSLASWYTWRFWQVFARPISYIMTPTPVPVYVAHEARLLASCCRRRNSQSRLALRKVLLFLQRKMYMLDSSHLALNIWTNTAEIKILCLPHSKNIHTAARLYRVDRVS